MEIINLDMVPGKKSPVCHASQYDDGRVIRFNLYDSGLPYTLDGTETITFEVRKPDGNIVISTLTNTSDSYVDVVTTEQMTAVKGANLCEVRVEKGGTNIGSLNVIMAVEMDPTDGGIASASEIDNLRSQISGMVAEEVAEQYDAGSVIFDSAPTPGHGNGYAVTSEGVATALGSKADRSELPDMSDYYDKTETDNLLDQKADTSSLSAVATSGSYNDLTDKPTIPTNAEQLPITNGSTTNTKTYIDNGLSEKADSSVLDDITGVSITCPRCPIASISNLKVKKAKDMVILGANLTFGASQAGNVYLLTSLFGNDTYCSGTLYDNSNDKTYILGKGASTSIWVREGADAVLASEFSNKSNIFLTLYGTI